MIEIKNADNTVAVVICDRLSLPHCDVFEMCDRDDRLGFACVQRKGESCRFLYLEAPDAALVDALLRAALNAMRAKGIKTAQMVHPPLRQLMVQKKYFSDLAEYELEIRDFFAKSACKG